MRKVFNCLVHPPLYFSKLGGARVSSWGQSIFGGKNNCHSEFISESLERGMFTNIFTKIPKYEMLKPVQHDKLYNASHCKSRCAFTLAEVLITLVIIGVVAALTIPNLMQKYTEQATVKRLQKFYSTLSNAYLTAKTNEGPVDEWGWEDYGAINGSVNGLNKFVPYLKVTKNCGSNNDCFPDVYYKYKNGTPWTKVKDVKRYAKALLDDGTSMLVGTYSKDCSYQLGTTKDLQEVCAMIHVDINGYEKPNTLGKDYYFFYLTKNAVIPAGIKGDNGYFPLSSCLSQTANGYGCAAWVIYKGNMDYLHCDGLTWNSRSCKDK